MATSLSTTIDTQQYWPNDIDVVYTWVNGSDPILIQSLTNITNQLFIKEQEESCLKNICRTGCILMPIIIIRPQLNDPALLLNENTIVKFDNTFNLNYTIVYFQHFNSGLYLKHLEHFIVFYYFIN